MKVLKVLLFGIVIGSALGMWVGFNMGKGKPAFSNPFVEETAQDKFKRKLGEGVEKAGESIEKLGEDIKGSLGK